ncbi:MAG: hypothetical protein JW940_36325 [Polyangiaceae bacterium]|nr:hypothetical protein [Polyangiaceae bacterium]
MNRLTWFLALSTLGIALAPAAGCGSDEHKKQLSDGCVQNSDCEGSLVCSFGHCHQQCETTKDCPSGGRCIEVAAGEYVCQLPSEKGCEYDSDCDDPLVCAADGECRNECQADRDCVTGQVCTTSKVCAEPGEVGADDDLLGAGGAGAEGGASAGGKGGKTGSGGTNARSDSSNAGTGEAGMEGTDETAGGPGLAGASGSEGGAESGGTDNGEGFGGSSSLAGSGGEPTDLAGAGGWGGESGAAGSQSESTGGRTGGSRGGTGGTSSGTGGSNSTGGKTTGGTGGGTEAMSGGTGGDTGGTTGGTGGSSGGASGGTGASTGGTGGDTGGTTGGTGGSSGGASGGTGGSTGGTSGGTGGSSGGTSGGSGGSSATGGGPTGGTGGGGPTPGSIWYVDQNSAGGDGTSWATAFATLQEALTNYLLWPDDQIWIAQGTYTPAASGGSRTTYFYLTNGVALYGGFHGTEATLADRDDPVDPSLTVLSGDLDANDGFDTSGNPTNRDENTYHVVVGATDAVLDGLTITGGNANGSAAEQQQGGGLYNLACDGLRVANVRFVSNTASGAGGGLYNAAGSYTTEELVEVIFARNRAGSQGGGLYNASGNATLTGVTFVDNQATYGGGGMSNPSGDPVITRAVFVGNATSSNGGGGGLYVSGGSPKLTDVTFGGNHADFPNGSPAYGGGMFIAGGAPQLVNTTFVGNMATGLYVYGGGIGVSAGNPMLTNVTVFGNTAAGSTSYGGGVRASGGSPKLVNALIWGNYVGSTISEISGSGMTFSHSNVHTCGGSAAWNTGCGTDDGGNIDTATTPFAAYRAPSGSWTEDPVYSAATLQTTFTNALAPWAPGELVGMFIQPDTGKSVRLPIIANTTHTLTVWSDAASTAASGTMYYIYDVRLAAGSECVDHGDNAALPADSSDLDADGNLTEAIPLDLDGRPRVINDTVDMGAYEQP